MLVKLLILTKFIFKIILNEILDQKKTQPNKNKIYSLCTKPKGSVVLNYKITFTKVITQSKYKE